MGGDQSVKCHGVEVVRGDPQTMLMLSRDFVSPSSHAHAGGAQRIEGAHVVAGLHQPIMLQCIGQQQDRTRSVLLLTDALEHDWLVKPGHDVRALDALCATGVRVRRWRNEVSAQHQHRLRIAANDLDTVALDRLVTTHERFPPAVSVDHALEDDRYERPPSGTMHNLSLIHI